MFVVLIPHNNVNSLKKELRGDTPLNTKIKLPPKSQQKADVVEIRIDVTVSGTGHERIIKQTIEAHKGTIVGEPDLIGNRSEIDKIEEIFRQGWILMIIAYSTITGSVMLFNIPQIENGTFDYVTVLLGAIPIAIGSVLARVRMIKIDLN